MSCVPFIPVPIQPTLCLGDICKQHPYRGGPGTASLAHVCCMLGEGRSDGEQGAGSAGARDEGHEPGCVGCQGWSRGRGEGGRGKGHGEGAGGVGRGHTAPHLAPCTHPSSPCCVLTFTPCAVWLAAARGSRQPSWWAAGAVPALPGSVRTGPVPCRDPALCCCLHGPQLSKPHCQMPGAVSFLPGVGMGWGAARMGRTADTQRGQQVYSQLTVQGSIPSQVGMAGP